MKNQKGFAEVAILYGIIALLAVLFIPNPVSKVLGVGVQPNKTIQTEKVDLLKNADGTVIGTKTTCSDQDIPQHTTFWQWLGSLPIVILILMVLGIFCPPLALWLHNQWSSITSHTKKIVDGVDAGLATLKDPVVKQTFLDEMTKIQGKNSATEALVSTLQKS